MRRACLWVVVFAVALAFASCSRKSSDMLDQLDRTLADSRKYVNARQVQLDSLKDALRAAATDEARYRLAGTLREMYTPFNADTALYWFFRSFVGWPFSNIKLSTSSFSFKRLKINSFVI